MNITRRQFNKSTLGGALGMLALGLGGGSLWSACGNGKSDGDESTETTSLNFDLRSYADGAEHTLHVANTRYRLQPHTDATRRRASRDNPALQRIPDAHLTHYALDVVLSSKRMHRIHVTTIDPIRGHGLALVAMHIPQAARLRARRRGAVGDVALASSGNPCDITAGQVVDGYLNGESTARSILMHHPDLCNTDPDAAAIIEHHLETDALASVDILGSALCCQGGAWEASCTAGHTKLTCPAGPNTCTDQTWCAENPTNCYSDGWAVLVPMLNSDGTVLIDPDSKEIVFDYVFSDATNTAIADALRGAVSVVKDDVQLQQTGTPSPDPTQNQGKQNLVIYHGDPVDTADFPEDLPPAFAATGAETQSALRRAAQSTESGGLTVHELGYKHNVLWFNPALVDRTITIKILNMNFLFYGLYVTFLDADHKPIVVPENNSFLTTFVDDVSLENETIKFHDVICSPPVLFGVPIPQPYGLQITLPSGASSVKIMLIGPGSQGNIDYPPTLAIGTILSAIFSFAVPAWFLSQGFGIETSGKLLDLIKNNAAIILDTLALGYAIYTTARGTSTNTLGITGEVEDLLVGLTKIAINQIPSLYEWAIGDFATAAVASLSFSGWVVRLIALVGTATDMFASEMEIVANPMVIENTLSLVHDIQFVIHPDVDNFEFPLQSAQVKVEVTPATTALTVVVSLTSDALNPESGTITVTVPNVPSTNTTAKVGVSFLAANGYLLAYSAQTDANGNLIYDENNQTIAGETQFLNAQTNPGVPLAVPVTIKQNPVPITATTTYEHVRRLEYKNGAHVWVDDDPPNTSPPAVEALTCTPTTLCGVDDITVWVPGGMVGYAWKAADVTECGSNPPRKGTFYRVRNLSLKSNPDQGEVPALTCGYVAPEPIAYDTGERVGEGDGDHFVLVPVNLSASNPLYALTRVDLDTLTVDSNDVWGYFRLPIDRMAVHNGGSTRFVVGISTVNHKFAVLQLPSKPVGVDGQVANAKILSGKGKSSDRLIYNPTALCVATNGAILILENNQGASRIKAFDFDGKPWRFFKNADNGQGPPTSSVLKLLPEADPSQNVTYLDIDIEPTNLVYVLLYTGDGTQKSQYRVDVYEASTGNRIVKLPNIAVARIAVDRFRDIYSANLETIKGSPIVEPSISLWAPVPPPSSSEASK